MFTTYGVPSVSIPNSSDDQMGGGMRSIRRYFDGPKIHSITQEDLGRKGGYTEREMLIEGPLEQVTIQGRPERSLNRNSTTTCGLDSLRNMK